MSRRITVNADAITEARIDPGHQMWFGYNPEHKAEAEAAILAFVSRNGGGADDALLHHDVIDGKPAIQVTWRDTSDAGPHTARQPSMVTRPF